MQGGFLFEWEISLDFLLCKKSSDKDLCTREMSKVAKATRARCVVPCKQDTFLYGLIKLTTKIAESKKYVWILSLTYRGNGEYMSVIIKTEYFSLSQICESGQCFRLKEITDGVFEIISGDKYLRASQATLDAEVIFDCSENEFDSYWKHYFALDEDYAGFIKAADKDDDYLQKAIKNGSGIRILNQDLWEMIVSFLISQQNNITRIRKCIDNICRKYGKECINKYGETYFAFPTAESMALLAEDALMECNLGYRSKYVVRMAKSAVNDFESINSLWGLSYDDAHKKLLGYYGIGKKVADCICLFALHHIEAFPIDTHINQVLNKYYPYGFDFARYEGFAGVMQQYIFFYELTN